MQIMAQSDFLISFLGDLEITSDAGYKAGGEKLSSSTFVVNASLNK
jgi:hypothetical protein